MLLQYCEDFMHGFAVYDVLEGDALLWSVVDLQYFRQNELKLVIGEL